MKLGGLIWLVAIWAVLTYLLSFLVGYVGGGIIAYFIVAFSAALGHYICDG